MFRPGEGGPFKVGGMLPKPLEKKTQSDTCINLARLCPRSTSQGVLLAKPRKEPRFGGVPSFFLGGVEQDTTPAGSRNHLKTRPNMTRATIWPTSAQDLRFKGGFC